MKVVFDHNVPRKLRRLLRGHYVSIALEMDWTTLRNGDLLRAAEEAGYDAMVTADQNLSYQQSLSGRRLALVILSTNNWNVIQRNPEPIIAAIDAAKPGSFQYVQVQTA